jgi:hypothetical protein
MGWVTAGATPPVVVVRFMSARVGVGDQVLGAPAGRLIPRDTYSVSRGGASVAGRDATVLPRNAFSAPGRGGAGGGDMGGRGIGLIGPAII